MGGHFVVQNRDFDDLDWKLECAIQILYGLYIIRRNFELIDSLNLWRIDRINYFSIQYPSAIVGS